MGDGVGIERATDASGTAAERVGRVSDDRRLSFERGHLEHAYELALA